MKYLKMQILLFVFLPAIVMAQTEKIDQAAMDRIRKEGLENSQIMDIAFQLTDVSGPRLTGSPGFMKAATYARLNWQNGAL